MSFVASFYFDSILWVLSKLFAIHDNITPPGIQVLEIQPWSSQPTYLIFVTDTTDGVCVKKNCPV